MKPLDRYDRTLDESNYMEGYPHAYVDHGQGRVYMTEADVERLSEYSTSLPTGVSVGKIWKRAVSDGTRMPGFTGFLLGFYWEEADTPEGHHIIDWLEIWDMSRRQAQVAEHIGRFPF